MYRNQSIAAIQSMSVAGNIEANVARHLHLAKIAAAHDATLALFPELSLTGYELAIAPEAALRCDDPRLDGLRALAREARITIVAGAPVRGDSGKLFVGALSFGPDGNVALYTKQHLHAGETVVFAPGDGGNALQFQGQKVALAVCADISQASHPALAAENGASIYAASVLVTDNGYATDAGLLKQYAQRHAMLVAMANHSGTTGGWKSAGRSAIWDADGELIVAAAGDGECIVLARQQEGSWHGEVIQHQAGEQE